MIAPPSAPSPEPSRSRPHWRARSALDLAHDGPIPAEALALAEAGTALAAARLNARRLAAEAEAAAQAARKCLAALRETCPPALLPTTPLSCHAIRLRRARDAAITARSGVRMAER